MSPLFNPVAGTDNRNSPEFLAELARWKAETEKAQSGWEAWTRQNPEAYRLSQIPEPGYSANTNITGANPAISQLLAQINGMAKTTSQFGTTGPNLNGAGEASQSSFGVNWNDMF